MKHQNSVTQAALAANRTKAQSSSRSAQAHRTSRVQVFNAVLPNLVIESILDPVHPNQLRLHTWDGRKAATSPTTSYRGCTYAPAPIPDGLAQAIRFSATSNPFGSAQELTG